MKTGIKVVSPATVGDLLIGCGSIGTSLDDIQDELIVSLSKSPGVSIGTITGDESGSISKDWDKNAAGQSVKALLDAFDESDLGVDINIRKGIPISSGLGSSIASACGAVVAVNYLIKQPYTWKELIPFVEAGLNVIGKKPALHKIAAAFQGGFMLCNGNEIQDIHRVHCPKGMHLSLLSTNISLPVFMPDNQIEDFQFLHNQRAANLAAFTLGMQHADFELIHRSNIIPPFLLEHFSKTIPHFAELRTLAIGAGSMGFGIWGPKLTFYCLSNNSLIANRTANKMEAFLNTEGISSTKFVSRILVEGAARM